MTDTGAWFPRVIAKGFCGIANTVTLRDGWQFLVEFQYAKIIFLHFGICMFPTPIILGCFVFWMQSVFWRMGWNVTSVTVRSRVLAMWFHYVRFCARPFRILFHYLRNILDCGRAGKILYSYYKFHCAGTISFGVRFIFSLVVARIWHISAPFRRLLTPSVV
jgi:hypothetical protein